MEKNGGTNKLIEAVHEAARSPDRRKIVRLREIFDEVQQAFEHGATYKIMVAALKKRGLEFTVRSLETTRSRIAKERRVSFAAATSSSRRPHGEISDESRSSHVTGKSSVTKEQQTIETPVKNSSGGKRRSRPNAAQSHEGRVDGKVMRKTKVASPQRLKSIINEQFDIKKFRNNND